MISRTFRLPSSVVFHSPITISEKEFLLRVQSNTVGYNRFGFVVGKSVDKLATARNALKRLVRAQVEKHWLGKSGNCDVLFILKPAVKITAQAELFQKIDADLGKAGLI